MTLKKYEPPDELLNTIQNKFPKLHFRLVFIIEEKKVTVSRKVTTMFLEDYLLRPEAKQTHWSLNQYDWGKILKELVLINKNETVRKQ